MAISTLILKAGVVSISSPETPTYAPSSTEPKKAAIVKSMRFTNVGTGTAKLQGWFKKGGGYFMFGQGARRILYDLAINPGISCVEDTELTLGPGDGIYFKSDVQQVEFVLFGVEQDVT